MTTTPCHAAFGGVLSSSTAARIGCAAMISAVTRGAGPRGREQRGDRPRHAEREQRGRKRPRVVEQPRPVRGGDRAQPFADGAAGRAQLARAQHARSQPGQQQRRRHPRRQQRPAEPRRDRLRGDEARGRGDRHRPQQIAAEHRPPAVEARGGEQREPGGTVPGDAGGPRAIARRPPRASAVRRRRSCGRPRGPCRRSHSDSATTPGGSAPRSSRPAGALAARTCSTSRSPSAVSAAGTPGSSAASRRWIAGQPPMSSSVVGTRSPGSSTRHPPARARARTSPAAERATQSSAASSAPTVSTITSGR